MKSRPILFSAPMVRALLAGTKTQTRRILKSAPPAWTETIRREHDASSIFVGHGWQPDVPRNVRRESWRGECPYGAPGDRLWVRESFWQAGDYHSVGDSGDCFEWHGRSRYFYAADGTPPNEPNRDYPEGLRNGAYSAAEPNKIWRRFPSIHMPREASRITLEITSVRVERLQDISEADAVAEGVFNGGNHWKATEAHPVVCSFAYGAYLTLWESINGAGSWDANPYVWVVEFKRVEGGAR